jgi:hypothetical protein
MPKLESCPHCGADLHDGKVPRSVEQHRRFFKLCSVAYLHWPESEDFQPTSPEHCRKELLMRAGHRKVIWEMEVDPDMPADVLGTIIRTALMAAGEYCRVVTRGNHIWIWKAKSIAFDKLDHQSFCRLNDEVDAVIQEVFGVTGDELLKETEKAA